MEELLNKKINLEKKREEIYTELEKVNKEIEKINDQIISKDFIGKCFKDSDGRYYLVKDYNEKTNRTLMLIVKQTNGCATIGEYDCYFEDFGKIFNAITKEQFLQKLDDVSLMIGNLHNDIENNKLFR